MSAICLNSSYCPNQQPSVGVNFEENVARDTFRTAESLKTEMKRLSDELKGLTLNITTLEDYPLSYVHRDNSTGAFVGRGDYILFSSFM